jgi:hypothetical protein
MEAMLTPDNRQFAIAVLHAMNGAAWQESILLHGIQ